MKNEGKKEKKLFFFFCPHTLTFRLKRPVYRGFSGEGKCEGKLSPLTLTLTPSWISLAAVRSVSLRLQNEGQKKLTDRTDAHGVFDTDFFDLCFFMQRDYKRICKRARLRLLRFRLSCDMLQYCIHTLPKGKQVPPTCKIRLKSLLSCQGTIKIKR